MKLYFSLKHSKMTTPEGNVEGEVGSALVLKSMCTFTSPKCPFISRIALLFSKNCPFLLQKCPFVSRNCPFVFQKYLSELHFSFTNCLFWISFQLIVRCRWSLVLLSASQRKNICLALVLFLCFKTLCLQQKSLLSPLYWEGKLNLFQFVIKSY